VVGGILSGHGTVNADVSVEPGGTLMPGGSIGTLTINGNLVFNNGSYLVELNPAAHSFTQVNGSATFNGGIVLLKPTLGFYGAQTYSIMNATGGLSATPNPPPLGFANSASINGVTLSTTPNDLILTFAASSASTLVTPAGSTTNQQNVANALNTFIIGGGTPPPGFQNLANLGGPALQGALDQLSGQAGGFFAQSAFTAGTQFFNTIFNPNIPGHSGGQLPYAPQSSSVVSRARDAFASLGYAAPPFGDPRYSVWGTAYGGAGSVNGDPVVGSVNASASVAGFAAGIDTRIARDTTVGMALAGGGTSWSLAQGLGSGSSSMFQAAVYGTHWWGPAYISGALAYAYHDVTTKRTVTVAGIDLLQGRFQANGVAARLEGGYRLAMNTFGITPYGAVQAQWIHIPGYTEVATSGLPQFALNYQSQNPSTTRTELGARFDHRYVVNRDADLTLYSRIAWAHDFNDNSSRASAFFQALPGSNFIVNAAKPFTDSALVTAGANYALASGWSLQLKFDGEFSDNTSIYAGSGTLRKVW
jgi:outer membrane autotransporter protein